MSFKYIERPRVRQTNKDNVMMFDFCFAKNYNVRIKERQRGKKERGRGAVVVVLMDGTQRERE